MFSSRKSWRAAGRLALPVLLLAGSTSVLAAQRAHVGTRTGVTVDTDDLFLGAHLTAPLTGRLELYPSLDYFFPSQGSMVGFNGDVKVRIPTGSSVQFFTGTGLNLMRTSVNGNADTDLGANLIGGVETTWGRVHPFVESRLRFSRETAYQIAGGINITLGGPRYAAVKR